MKKIYLIKQIGENNLKIIIIKNFRCVYLFLCSVSNHKNLKDLTL